MTKRYELTKAQWREIKDLLPGKAGDRGRTAVDNRTFVDGCLWVLRSGAYWCHLPERYGNWKKVPTSASLAGQGRVFGKGSSRS
jgi:transposase